MVCNVGILFSKALSTTIFFWGGWGVGVGLHWLQYEKEVVVLAMVVPGILVIVATAVHSSNK